MVTDDERRRVAAALRRADAERLDRVYGNDPSHASLTLGLVAEAAGLHYAPYEVTAVEVRNRLADLIEPISDMLYVTYSRSTCGPISDMLYVTYSRSTCGPDGRAYMVKVRHRTKGWERDFYAVDREALLALAEDVAESAAMVTVMDASEGAKMLAEMLLDIARRIREACGVTG